MRVKNNTILLFYLAVLLFAACLPSCLDADNDVASPNEMGCDPSTPSLNISVYRILTKDSFQGISLTEIEKGESIRYDSVAMVMTFFQGSACPSKEQILDSTQVISLKTYDELHQPYAPLNDIMEVVLQSEQAIYPVPFDEYEPGSENQFIVLLTQGPDQAGEQQFALWYNNRPYQLTTTVNIQP
ncbi:MAG: hypothetical protein WBB45_08790 [Cyclobacteriaceae bacterium]